MTGENFPAEFSSTALSVKASSNECSGDSAATDVLRGGEQTATVVSASSSTVSFVLGPIADTVSRVSITEAGTGYAGGKREREKERKRKKERAREGERELGTVRDMCVSLRDRHVWGGYDQ